MWNVGDLFTIGVEGVGIADQGTVYGSQVHQVTAITAPVADTSAAEITFSPALEAVPNTVGDAIRITIIGRTQDPQSRCSQLARNVNVYSFALKPEEHQPSGTCNFSRIDNATLQLVISHNAIGETNTAKVRVYAKNYNVFRVLSGMGGLSYSN